MGVTKKIEISRKVLFRDGIALIIAEFIFLVLISGSTRLASWAIIDVCLCSLYRFYVCHHGQKDQRSFDGRHPKEDEIDESEETENKESPSFF